MAGHSKWAKLKHKKGTSDAKKSALFSKLVRFIAVEARKAKGDRSAPNLRAAVDKARAANMPSENIDRAIEKASQSGELEPVTYEAYGPGGVAILIKTITQNRNRTVAELKHILSKNGGVLAEAGSVKWQFDEKGGAKFPVAAQEKDAAALRNLLAELEGEEDVQEIFTNQK